MERQNMTDLSYFHIMRNGKAVSAHDFHIYEDINKNLSILIVGQQPFIYSGGVFRQDPRGTRLKSEIRKRIYPELIRSNTIDRIYKLFTDSEELQTAPEDLNAYPVEWINFQNGFYDPVKREMNPHSPTYKAVNQIPHEYNPAAQIPEDSELVRWIQFITPDLQDREMLLQYCGLCMTRDIRQQKFLILNGSGGTGKSTLIKLLELVIGSENISGISLKDLAGRFASYGLMGKLLNSCADLETAALEDTSTIKKILGEDLIKGEAKGKDAVFFRSYAKLIFSTNELPAVLSEKTNGFYRRLLILTMNRIPPKIRPDFLQALEKEIDVFILLCVKALQRMYEAGCITVSENSRKAVETMRADSDSVQAWIINDTETDADSQTDRRFLYERYKRFCDLAERQALTRNSFYKSLRLKGYTEGKTDGGRWFSGLKLIKEPLTSY